MNYSGWTREYSGSTHEEARNCDERGRGVFGRYRTFCTGIRCGPVGRDFAATDGMQSPNWHHTNSSGITTQVQFNYQCTHNFTSRIRRNNLGPDTTVGSEFINCHEYNDSVYSDPANLPTDDYHFDYQFSSGGPVNVGWIVWY